MKKYSMIQINAEVHSELKKFCKDKGYKISGLVESLIKERIEKSNPKQKRVLSSESRT
jgi:post-segregation antitoxin (ccd killing protein)